MQLNLSQHMKMSQQMKLAPRMIQSMEILQLPVMALNERIEQELQENVVLEKGPDEETEAETAQATEEPPVQKNVEERELVVDEEHNNEADFARLPELMGRGVQPAAVDEPEPESEPAVEAPAEQLGLF